VTGPVVGLTLADVGQLDVCTEGLRAAGSSCEAHAGRLADQVPTGIGGPVAQATAAAVGAAYTALGECAAALAARVRFTGEKLSVSAAEFSTMDRTFAGELSVLGRL
jgi:hypothetical protein